MTLAERLKQLRQELGLTQEAIGAQGFVSTPGWIKIENGQRQASEQLLADFVSWLVRDHHVRAHAARALTDELLTLKCLGSRSPFVRTLAQTHARENKLAHLLEARPVVKAARGRPRKRTGKAVAA